MLVSWNWLKDYVELPMSPDEATARLMMAGLNHESTEKAGNDFCIDLEITSNRADCLGHIGVAREISVLFGHALKVPGPQPKESSQAKAADLTSVTLEAPALCPRYIARVIRGVKIKPSPAWMQDKLRTIGVAAISNVVDVTNYVLMECGQPLHAFDLAKLKEQRIIVREAKAGEPFEAINHVTYKLEPGMCVIADAERPVALGGVMGGADTEVSARTTDLLIEAAEFSPLSIRSTARKLKLHSPSSYRFERGLDPEGLDWASRRCCQLILDLAGGELATGAVDVGAKPQAREPVTLRLSQVKRILGIEIPAERIAKILQDLGCAMQGSAGASPSQIVCIPPSWRRDLTREIDLIEEAARIHGYDQIPEDSAVPMAASHRSDADRVLATIRRVMTAAGFDEAMTPSVVTPAMAAHFSPWSDSEPLATNQPMLEGSDRARKTLIPSVLESRQLNEARGNATIDLFETAKIYLPQSTGLPREQLTLAASTGGDYYALKGVIETLVQHLNPASRVSVQPIPLPLLQHGQTVEVSVDGQKLGFLGVVSAEGRKQFGLRGATTIFEFDVGVLERIARLVPKYEPLSRFPAMTRDLNLIVDEAIRWADLEATISSAAGEQLSEVRYLDTYRDPAKDGPGKKRLLFSMSLRSLDRTLTGDEVDQIRDRVVQACSHRHAAALLM
jgi:phenylalanyl-tRNA synthetase beta chain